MKRLSEICSRALLLGGGLALLARLPDDRWLPAAVLVYGTPWLVMGGLGMACFLLLRPSWKWLALPLLGFAVQGAWKSLNPMATSPPGRAGLTVANWNAARKLAQHPEHWNFPADITVITETGPFADGPGDAGSSWSSFLARDPGISWQAFGEGLTLGVRGRILDHEKFGDARFLRCVRTEVETRNGLRLDVILVDIRSQPWLSRRPALEAIFQQALRDRPTLVMGDFNTPAESLLLKSAVNGHLHPAHDFPVSGFRETWPWGLPLLTLDQIWTGGGLRPLSTRKEIRHSDHQYVESILTLESR